MIGVLTMLGNWSVIDQPSHRVDAVNDNAIDIIAQQETLPLAFQETTERSAPRW